MAESLPSQAILSTVNMVVDQSASIVSVTSEKNLFRKERIRDARRTATWRSTSDGAQSIVVKLQTADKPQVVSLVNCNVSSGETITLKSADDESIATNVATWNLSTYAQSRRKTLRWYLGTADANPENEADRLYWEFTLPNNGSDSTEYYELGLIWMGDYTAFNLGSVGRSINDPSEIAVSDGGARYPDVRDTSHELDVDTPAHPEADAFSIADELDLAGATRHVLLDLWAPTSTDANRANGTYYGTFDEDVLRMDRSADNSLREDLGFSFVEARA